MPTYEYLCPDCQNRVEAVQRFSDPPLTTCENCGGTLKRVFHPVGIVLKGSGFYATDSRSNKALTPSKKEATTSSDGGSSDSGSSSAPKEKAKPASDSGSSSSGSSTTGTPAAT